MSSTLRNLPEENLLTVKMKRILHKLTQYFFSSTRDYLKIRVWLILIPLIVLLVMGKLFTKGGLLIILFIGFYIVLNYIYKHSGKKE